jgi:hypothetical protein
MARAEESPLMLAGANRPLAGIVVLDFGQVYQGPYATLLMAKAGTERSTAPDEFAADSPLQPRVSCEPDFLESECRKIPTGWAPWTSLWISNRNAVPRFIPPRI